MIKTLTPILSIALALLIYFFFTQEHFETIRNLKSEVEQYQEAVDVAIDRNSKLSEKLAMISAYGARDTERLNQFVPQSIDPVRVLVDLSEVAKKNGMLFGNTQIAEVKKSSQGKTNETDDTSTGISSSSFAAVDVSFGAIGTYEQFKSLLADIERSLTLMEVVKVNFSSSEGDLNQFNITVRVFSLPTT